MFDRLPRHIQGLFAVALVLAIPVSIAAQRPPQRGITDHAPAIGTVFELVPSASGYSVRALHHFGGGPDGTWPLAGLVSDRNGSLYGTTYYGGATGNNGTVFRITPSESGYSESVLYSFRGFPSDGAQPVAGLTIDAKGALYGTTLSGGVGRYEYGTVFKLTPSGSSYRESVIHSFGLPSDGIYPLAGLIVDGAGNVYGTASGGGSAQCTDGIVFKLAPVTPSRYAETIIHCFQGSPDGESPAATLIADRSGALYGTTIRGGRFGDGIVFKLTPSGATYTESVLLSFDGKHGALPVAGLVADANGTLYGTTWGGGHKVGCGGNPRQGCGTVFALTRQGSGYVERVLHYFQSRADGDRPEAGLTMDAAGALFGTTFGGGGFPCGHGPGCGVVFKLTPEASGYQESILYRFKRRHRVGFYPYGNLVLDHTGALFGTTSEDEGTGF